MGQNQAGMSGHDKIIFGEFATKDYTFMELLMNEQSWCWKFILNYSDNPQQYLDETNDVNFNKEIERNCCDLFKFLCNNSISHKNTLQQYRKNCKQNGIIENIPTLITEIFWLFSKDVQVKVKQFNIGNVGKWMLFCNKHFITYSYKRLQYELSTINHNDNEEQKGSNEKEMDNKKDIMLTELDYFWLKVDKLTKSNNLGISAKVSTNAKSSQYNEKADGVIIIYCANSNDKDDVLRVAQNIRKLVGFNKEEIRYKTDQATIKGKYGAASHLYKHTLSKYDELQLL